MPALQLRARSRRASATRLTGKQGGHRGSRHTWPRCRGPTRNALRAELQALDAELRGEVGSWPAARETAATHIYVQSPGDEATSSPPGGDDGPRLGRYRDLGEIGRGGMGVVHRVRDLALHRDLALKVLSRPCCEEAEAERRFIEEAQVVGQLQHPGIPPLHELGYLPDGRPYFTMKLIKGRTFRELLKERPSPDTDLPRFVAVFEQVTQTIAYAHSKRVLHRDLKPSNVMVGAFGEVQVMDWGLAKVLKTDETRGLSPDSTAAEVSVIRTVRAEVAGADTQSGSFLGTPEYIAPEQARGEIDDIDERSDVFGLGATLCEILCGRPPYVGRSGDEVRRKAARADLADALADLDGCGADAELISLARACLAPEPLDRPRDAARVVEAIAVYRAGVDERLRRAELARVEEQARAEHEREARILTEARVAQERRARRLAVALAVAVMALATLAGSTLWSIDRQNRDRAARFAKTARDVDEALAEVAQHRDEARAAPVGDLTKWNEALGAARRADDLMKQGEVLSLQRGRVAALRAELESERAEAVVRGRRHETDRTLLADLEAIRVDAAEFSDPKRTDANYAAAFREAGLDLDATDPGEVGRWIAGRSDPVRLSAYLDAWALTRRIEGPGKASWRRLVAASSVADPDPWRDDLRARVGATDADAIAVFRALADAEDQLDAQPAESLLLLAAQLISNAKDYVRAERVLRRAWRRFPSDYMVSMTLAQTAGGYIGAAIQKEAYLHPEEALRFLSAAIAAHPRSFLGHLHLGTALTAQGRFGEAIAEFRGAIRLNPYVPRAHTLLAKALHLQGDVAGAITESREAIRLIEWLRGRGATAVALTGFREAIRLKPDEAEAHYTLGYALGSRGNVAGAIAEFCVAIRLKPGDAEAHCGLGSALRKSGDYTESLTEYRRGHELGSKWPGWSYPSAEWVRQGELLASLAPRLPAVLKGDDRPADSAELLAFGEIAHSSKLYAESAYLYSEAFHADPRLADDLQAGHRYNAACSAALASARKGDNNAPRYAAGRTKLRQLAREWLQADLAVRGQQLESGTEAVFSEVRVTLQHWNVDSDLAGVHDPEVLYELPAEEQQAWRELWGKVDTLLAKARSGP